MPNIHELIKELTAEDSQQNGFEYFYEVFVKKTICLFNGILKPVSVHVFCT